MFGYASQDVFTPAILIAKAGTMKGKTTCFPSLARANQVFLSKRQAQVAVGTPYYKI